MARRNTTHVIYATESFVAKGHLGYSGEMLNAGDTVAEFTSDKDLPQFCEHMRCDWGWPVSWQRVEEA